MSDRSELPRVIAVTSGKGGVGKSSISINLGISLAKTGARVCLLDADTGLANANILLGLQPEFSLEHVLYGAKAIEDVMMDGPYGMKIIPGATGISECVSLHPRQQLRLIRELARVESDYDFLLIDTAAGVADTTLDFISASHYALIVITPEPTSLTDAFSMIKLLKRRNSPVRFQVVVNMSGSAGQAKEVFHRFSTAVEKYIGVESRYLGFILRDESMRAAVVLQNPVTMFPDTDPSCRSFKNLAEKLDTATAEFPADTAFSTFWQRQYAEQHGGAVPEPATAVQPAPAASKAASPEDDYVVELQSRIQLLIEQGRVPASRIQTLLQTSQQAFIERFETVPVNVLQLVEYVVASPNRDDQLVRDIAERVRPWLGYSIGFAPSDLSLQDLALDQAADQQASGSTSEVPPISFDIVNEQGSISSDTAASSGDHDNSAPVAQPNPAVVDDRPPLHGYDADRFGSQQSLLARLQHNPNRDKPLLELLQSLQWDAPS